MTRTEVRALAALVVDSYAESVSMTLPEQGELERALAAQFVADAHVSTWIEPANAVLSAWEETHPQRGPRVQSISPASRQVTMKARRIW